MTDWKPSSKYEIAPGFFIGSEISDLDRERKKLLKRYLEGEDEVMHEITKNLRHRERLLMPKGMRE